MTIAEVEALSMIVSLSLNAANKKGQIIPPAVVTMSDVTDYVFLDHLWDGSKFHNIFGVGRGQANFSQITLPITVAVIDHNADRYTIDVKQADINQCFALGRRRVQ